MASCRDEPSCLGCGLVSRSLAFLLTLNPKTLQLFDLDGRLVQVGGEDPFRDGLASQGDGREFIGFDVEMSIDVVKVEALELLLQLVYSITIHAHSWVTRLNYVHDLVAD